MDQRTRNGILFTFMAIGGFAFLPIWTKLIYRYSDLTGLDIAGWRFMIAVPLLWAILWLRGRRNPDKPAPDQRLPRLKLLLLGVALAAGALAAFYGLGLIDASIYTVLFRTQPIMVVVLNAFLGERFPLRGWLALLVVVTGASLVAFEPGVLAEMGGEAGQLYMWGVGIALLNALAIAVYNIGQERVMTGFNAKLPATAWTITGTLMVLTPLILLFGLAMPPNRQTTGALIGLATLSTFIPTFALYAGIERIGASRLSIVASVEPLLAVLLAVVLLGEDMLSAQQLIGGAMVISSLFVLEARLPRLKRRQPRKQQPVASGD